MKYDRIASADEYASLVRADDVPGMLSCLRTLARMMVNLTGEAETRPEGQFSAAGDRRKWGALAQALHRVRSQRAKYFPAELFGEPAWDILLDLAHAAQANELRSIKAVCLAAQVPEATALRYVERLIKHGLVQRKPDRFDKRRKYLTLSPLGERRMRDFLITVPPLGDQGEDIIRQLLLEADAERTL